MRNTFQNYTQTAVAASRTTAHYMFTVLIIIIGSINVLKAQEGDTRDNSITTSMLLSPIVNAFTSREYRPLKTLVVMKSIDIMRKCTQNLILSTERKPETWLQSSLLLANNTGSYIASTAVLGCCIYAYAQENPATKALLNYTYNAWKAWHSDEAAQTTKQTMIVLGKCNTEMLAGVQEQYERISKNSKEIDSVLTMINQAHQTEKCAYTVINNHMNSVRQGTDEIETISESLLNKTEKILTMIPDEAVNIPID